MEDRLPWLAAALVVLPLAVMLRGVLKSLLRLAMRSAVGLGVLAAAEQVLAAAPGVNLINALVLGALGAPGFGLLLMLQWTLRG